MKKCLLCKNVIRDVDLVREVTEGRLIYDDGLAEFLRAEDEEYIHENCYRLARRLLRMGCADETLLVTCFNCKKKASSRTAHYVNKDRSAQWCCDNCWDERLR